MRKNIIFIILSSLLVFSTTLNYFRISFNLDFIFYLFLATFVFKYTSNSKKRISKYKVQTLFIITSLYIIFYLVLGLFIGYSKNIYTFDLKTFFLNFKFFILMPILYEILRNYLLNRKNKFNFIILSLLFSLLYVNVFDIFFNSASNIEFYRKMLEYFIPSLIGSFIYSYFSLKIGFISVLIIIIPVNIMFMITPILPKTDWFMELIIKSIFYLCLFSSIKTIEKKFEYKISIKNNSNILFLPLLTGFVIFLLFVAGFFDYKPVAILSDSMLPIFKRGDLVIVKNSKHFQVGDIIQYRRDKVLVIHRIISIEKKNNGDQFYVTKGDNNKYKDTKKVNHKDIIGIVKISIPKIGYPTILVHELINKNNIEVKKGEINNE